MIFSVMAGIEIGWLVGINDNCEARNKDYDDRNCSWKKYWIVMISIIIKYDFGANLRSGPWSFDHSYYL